MIIKAARSVSRSVKRSYSFCETVTRFEKTATRFTKIETCFIKM